MPTCLIYMKNGTLLKHMFLCCRQGPTTSYMRQRNRHNSGLQWENVSKNLYLLKTIKTMHQLVHTTVIVLSKIHELIWLPSQTYVLCLRRTWVHHFIPKKKGNGKTVNWNGRIISKKVRLSCRIKEKCLLGEIVQFES